MNQDAAVDGRLSTAWNVGIPNRSLWRSIRRGKPISECGRPARRTKTARPEQFRGEAGLVMIMVAW